VQVWLATDLRKRGIFFAVVCSGGDRVGGTGCTLPGRPPRTHARTLDGRIGAYFVGPSTNGSDSKCSLQL